MNTPVAVKRELVGASALAIEGTGPVDVERQRQLVAAWREEDTRPYECDGLTLYRQLPMVVVLPESESQVQQVLRCCRVMQVPVVPRGAGTSLSGGALPQGAGVLLSLAKFNRIVAIDARAR